MTRVKICGLTRREDAELSISLGAHALGFIFEPTSPRFLPEPPPWILDLPPYVSVVAVYGKAPESFNYEGFHAVQGEGWTSTGGPFTRVSTVRLRPEMSVEDVLREAQFGGAIHLDAFVEDAYGGTGKKVDWELAAEIVKTSSKPVILAGGLNPDNVAEAVARVRPFAVDVSSGVESEPRVKDHGKLREFVQAVLRVT